MKKITIHLDADSGKVELASDTKDVNGNPVLEWSMDTKSGEVVQTSRNATTGSERVVEKTIDVSTLKNPDATPQAVIDAASSDTTSTAKTSTSSSDSGSAKDTSTAESSTTTTAATTTTPTAAATTDSTDDAASKAVGAITTNWDDMEMQRDVAFKIIYFFILFIIATFGLLYAYFKMSKKELIEQERKARAKGIFFGEPTQQTFFDFLSG